MPLWKSAGTHRDDITSKNRKQPDTRQFRLGNFPELKPRDMIVEVLGNKRWRVDEVHPSYVQGSLVSQAPICGLIIKTDIEYAVPVRGFDPIRFAISAAHHYEGSSNTESQIEARNRLVPPEV